MSNTILTIDIDNVLCDTARAFLTYYEQKFWDLVQYDDVKFAYIQDNECFEKFVDLPWVDNAYQQFFYRACDQDAFSPCVWAVHTVWQLKDVWFELYAVSGRWESQRTYTTWWIDQYFHGMFDDIFLLNDHSPEAKPKWEVCKNLWTLVHLDDFHHYAQTISKEWIPTLLFDTPRNQAYMDDDPHIIRVGWRNDVMEQVMKIKSEKEERTE